MGDTTAMPEAEAGRAAPPPAAAGGRTRLSGWARPLRTAGLTLAACGLTLAACDDAVRRVFLLEIAAALGGGLPAAAPPAAVPGPPGRGG